jgi:hypothetical protein
MQNSKTIYWILIVIGLLGVLSSVYMFSKGKPFSDYFWGGFCGMTLMGTAFIQRKGKAE